MKSLDIIRKLGVNITDFYLVFSACLGSVYVTQSRFEQTITRGRQFKLNFKDCLIEFEDGDSYPMQYLGATNKDNIWNWGWNEKTEFSKDVFDFANQIKDFGEVHFADYAKLSTFKMNRDNFAHDLSSTICSMFGNSCFCEGKGENASLFVSVRDLPNEIFAPVTAKEFAQITMHALKLHKANHRLFVEAFLHWNNITYKYIDDVLIANFDLKTEVTFVKTDSDYAIKTIKVENPKNAELPS